MNEGSQDNALSKVLLIDDEKDVVSFFSGVFQNFKNVQFFTALNARQGIEIARQEKPKVILLDLRMPDLNGEDVLHALKPDLPDSKFIVMTGWDDGETRERIEREFSVDAYFDKPINLEKVIAKIFALLMVKQT